MEQNNQKAKKAPLIYAIVGVMTLIVAVAGSTYAFFSASTSQTLTGEAGGGEGPKMTLTWESKNANDKLIPIDMTKEMLTTASTGSSATGNVPCKDKNGYSVCKIYSVTIENKSDVAVSYKIGLTSLTGTDNVEGVKMASATSVTDATSIVGNEAGICTTESIVAGGTSAKCYFMVFIENLSTAQTDKGEFTGTVTAISSAGDEIKAQF